MLSAPLAFLIASMLVVVFVVHTLADVLNLRALAPTVPAEFEKLYDADSYARAQHYTRARTHFGWIVAAFDLLVLLGFWHVGGFGWVDDAIRELGLGTIPTGLLFIGSLALASELLALPFALYSTFVLEERFGFNRMDLHTFATDRLKGAALGIALGGALLSGVLAFFEWAGSLAWLYAWIATTVVSLGISFIAPTWILPLFNKFTRLEEGELRQAIFDYAGRVNFPLTNLFVIDGSKRSTKSNAFFTGFGKNKRIALYDTLVENHTVDELVGVMAHEIGHYKKAHVRTGMLISVLHFAVLFFLLSLIIESAPLFSAFGLEHTSVHAGLILFAILYTPVSTALGIAMNWLSRRHEFEADRYAVETTGQAAPLIRALKVLSLANLGNLTPHPIYVAMTYSHPPLLQRIAALRAAERSLAGP